MSASHFEQWKPNIDAAVVEICLHIIQEPLLYFSEADIQQLLVEELRKIKPLARLYPTLVPKGKNSKSTYHTSLVHREYGGGEGTRIDVVIFDPEDAVRINDVNLTKNKEYLLPAYAFELGTEKTTNTERHLATDVAKMQKRLKGAGYVIHIYKDVTQAPSGTRSRASTEERIRKDFKAVFAQNEETRRSKVKTIAVLLRTYRNQSKMRGKCEIFNGQSWDQVNIGQKTALRAALLKRLH